MLPKLYRSLFLFIIIILFSQSICAQDNHREFEFVYEVSIPKSNQNVKLWIPLPQTDEFQIIEEISVFSPYNYSIITEKKYLNKYLYLTVDSVYKGGQSISVKIKTVRKERSKPISCNWNGQADFLQENKLVPLNDDIRNEAIRICKNANTPEEKARAIYKHVIASVKYDKTGTGWGNGDVLYVCNERRGNCTDFHSLFIAMCRAIDIPARFSIGFSIPSDKKIGEIKGYHCWAEFFIQDKGWIAVDASEAFKHPQKKEYLFGNLDFNRIKFTLGRDIKLKESGKQNLLNFFIYPVCTVGGEIQAVDKHFYFKQINISKTKSISNSNE